ncbi:hypothetical protein A1O1_00549 [Capronia coronata CBS 617.96]|uniref:Amine oxidase domain-containing protein n=1 Tax=Capronia coronata CBS 617.96 TaxID=1182541 RepID=W9YSD2_9EURO|nr:uncharacterized protein A1O1_00549 [Capronia coronata CBS 617.96]EXJ95428.1 hypothetical protein A1O1_00549 [Capronia coronata CBS 617.96]
MGKRVAIVGSGCSGIGALWALHTSTDHEVHLFESASRLGGHSNTVTYNGPNGSAIQVDTGFTVLYEATCPNFLAFLNEIGVPTAKTEMTFGISRDQGTFEWAETSLFSIFAQRRNLFSLSMWRLIFDVIRFDKFALDVLNDKQDSENEETSCRETIAKYLDREGYSQGFRDDYLVPVAAAIWSTSLDMCPLEFPAHTLIRFMYNHHLLSTAAKRSNWLIIPGGANQYIDAVLKDFPTERIHLECKVTALASTGTASVRLIANSRDQEFDHVILATHGDQALQILGLAATTEEAQVLSRFHSTRNLAVLHSDISLMPKLRTAWSSWNCITESPFPPRRTRNVPKVCLTSWANSLQHISGDEFGPVLLTLNPLTMPDPRQAHGIWEYSHPQFHAAATEAQRLLPSIQNTRNISYCGAWTGDGFHEAGFRSGLSVAMYHLGATLPFEFVDSAVFCGGKPALTIKDHLLRLFVLIVQIAILLAEGSWRRLATVVDRRIASRRSA